MSEAIFYISSEAQKMNGFFPNSVNKYPEGQTLWVSCCTVSLKPWRWMLGGEMPQGNPPASRASFKDNSKVTIPGHLWFSSDPQESSHHGWNLLCPQGGESLTHWAAENVLQLLCHTGQFSLRALWKSDFQIRRVSLGSFNKLLPGCHWYGREEDGEGLQGLAPGTPPGQLLALFWFCWLRWEVFTLSELNLEKTKQLADILHYTPR